jgi:hypothetical protein
MRENPIGNALAFLVATDKLWFTVIFWLLLVGSAAVAAWAWRADPAQRSLHHIGYGLMRVIVGIMWWQQSLWKIPPHWDRGLIPTRAPPQGKRGAQKGGSSLSRCAHQQSVGCNLTAAGALI